MRIVEKVELYKGKTMRVDFSEGEPEFINAEVCYDCGVSKGAEFSDEAWDKVIYKNDLRRAKERALYLLDYRDYSYSEMFKKLSENYSEQLCYDVCDKLTELGVINDRRYAAQLARRYVEIKKYGLRRAKQEMRLKGLGSELIDEALSQYEDSTRDRIRELIEKKYLRRIDSEDGVKKVKNALVRQGYSFADINAVFDELFEEYGDEFYD